MKLNFCTLFNSNYLSRGIALYRSLENCATDFHLFVFAFDEQSENYLRKQEYKNMTVVGLKEFEDSELLRVKPSRSAAEYCWTCTSSTILYSIEKFKLDHCTYLDADMLFYSDPSVLINEMGEKDILITEHRYSPVYDQSKESGRFCVQFVTFKNTENGMTALRWWRNACIEWCYNRVEDGKFGDQKYLDDWETRFKGVHVLEHLGGGVAPWNLQQYNVFQKNDKIFIREKKSGNEFPLVFFHFHGVKFYANGILSLSGAAYNISSEMKEILFFPYIKTLVKIADEIKISGAKFDANGASGKSPTSPWGFSLALFYYLADVKASLKNIGGRNMGERKLHHHYYSTANFQQ